MLEWFTWPKRCSCFKAVTYILLAAAFFFCVKLLLLQYWWPLGCSFIAFYKLYFITYRRALSYLPEFTDSHKYLKDCHKYLVPSKFNPQLTMENYSSNISDAASFVAEHFGTTLLYYGNSTVPWEWLFNASNLQFFPWQVSGYVLENFWSLLWIYGSWK